MVGRAIVPVVSASSPDEGLVVPLETFTTLGGTETVADIDVEAMVLATAGESDVEAVGRAIEATGATLDGPFRQASVTSLGEVRGIPFYLAGFTAFIGTLSVFHTLFVTSRRRRGGSGRSAGRSDCRPRRQAASSTGRDSSSDSRRSLIGCPLQASSPDACCGASIATNTNVLAVIDIAVDAHRRIRRAGPRLVQRSSSPPAPPGRLDDVRRESICEPSDGPVSRTVMLAPLRRRR